MTINTLPTAPTRSMSPADFVAAANTFLAALPTFSSQVNADLAALLTLSQLVSTSTTSLTIGTGSKSLTVQTSKAYLVNQVVRIYSTTTPDNYMDGTVTSYDSGTGALVVNVTASYGSGTLTAWTVILNGGLATTAQIQSGALVAITATLTGTEYSATPSPAITAYATNQSWDITFSSACPAAPTLKLNGIATPPNLVRQNADGTYSNLAAGAFPAGWRSTVRAISASQVLVDRLPPRRKILTATRDVSLASGNASYTGAGFRPRKVTLRAVIAGTNAWSNGSNVGITGTGLGANGSYCLYGNNPVGAYVQQDTYLGLIYVSSGNWNYIDVASFDSDGITLAFAKNGTPTGTATLLLELEE